MTARPFAIAAAVWLAACSTSAQPARQQAPSDVVATVGGTSFTLADVDERALQQSASSYGSLTLLQAMYEARRAAINELVGNHLLDREAKARGMDRTALSQGEILSKVSPPTDTEISEWYAANPARVQGATLEQVKEPIRKLLVQERTEQARQHFLDALKAKTPVRIALEPPRLKVAEGGRPARGPSGAPVQIIEFSDFQCPFCLRAYPTVTQVLSTYGDRIRFVYRHYPLPNHPNARPAAEASACANEQDKFWVYHDRLFSNPEKLSEADLKRHAAELGLNAAKFNECFDSRKYQQEVDADLAAGEAAGVTGTPAFFINGRPLTGSMPFDAFKRIIDEELTLKR